jgi:predicted nucleic acid-binding protein
MRESVFDTRFFVELIYSPDTELLQKMKEEFKKTGARHISSITIHELYRLILMKEGRREATTRCETVRRDFKIVDVNAELAVISAELRQKYRIPMADSIIAATALRLRAPVVTDDEHFRRVREIKTRWF